MLHSFLYTTRKALDPSLVTIDTLTHAVEELKVPQPTPYLAGRTAADFVNGANFALGGATALDQAFLATKGIKPFVPISLANETSWFQNVLQLLDASDYGKNYS